MANRIKVILMEALNEEDAEAIIDHRRTTIRKPLTERAARNLVREFQKVYNTTEAVDLIIDKCWRGFKAEWMASEQRSRFGSSGSHHILQKYQDVPPPPQMKGLTYEH